MTMPSEGLLTPIHEATVYPAVNLLAGISEQDIEDRLGANQTAHDIWENAEPFLNGETRAKKLWDVLPITPHLKIPREALPKDIQKYERDIYFLADGMMPSGAYKLGGVVNAVLSELERNPDLAEIHVASTGNHAAAASLVAMLFGLKCVVYMPYNAVPAKVENAAQYGALIQSKPSLQHAVEAAQEADQGSAKFIHPYDQLEVIAGQGSATVRLYRQLGALGIDPARARMTYPLGGTGNAAGNAVVGAVMLPGMQIHAAQAEGCNPAVDGAAVALENRGAYGKEIIGAKRFVQATHDVSLGAIGEAMAVTARFTDVYEPAGAMALAAALRNIRSNPHENVVEMVHGSGINTTPEKVREFAKAACDERYLSEEEAQQLVSRAGIDSRRRNSLEEQVRLLVAERAGTAAVRNRCFVVSGLPRP